MKRVEADAHGSPLRHTVADRQRVPDGRITCPLCDRIRPIDFEGEMEMEMDRIVPGKRGGEYALENCQLVCRRCNRVGQSLFEVG